MMSGVGNLELLSLITEGVIDSYLFSESLSSGVLAFKNT